jgi:hypothetical protein
MNYLNEFLYINDVKNCQVFFHEKYSQGKSKYSGNNKNNYKRYKI